MALYFMLQMEMEEYIIFSTYKIVNSSNTISYQPNCPFWVCSHLKRQLLYHILMLFNSRWVAMTFQHFHQRAFYQRVGHEKRVLAEFYYGMLFNG